MHASLKLIDWIRDKMCPGLPAPGKRSSNQATWNDTRVIIFTEYDDTKRYLHQQLSAAIDGTDRADDRIAIFHGPTPHDEREAIKLAFNADPAKHPLRILIATDAAREGLNLQAHCWNLFHFDVPWNPSRMEQRNGRIDRKLQPSPEVFCHYFVYQQRPEDRILVGPRPQDRDNQEGAGQPRAGDRRPAGRHVANRDSPRPVWTRSNTRSKRPTWTPTAGRSSRRSWRRRASGKRP